jgi:hypothetical protein
MFKKGSSNDYCVPNFDQYHYVVTNRAVQYPNGPWDGYWDTAAFGDGDYWVTVSAWDWKGGKKPNVATNSLLVKVCNQPPC